MVQHPVTMIVDIIFQMSLSSLISDYYSIANDRSL